MRLFVCCFLEALCLGTWHQIGNEQSEWGVCVCVSSWDWGAAKHGCGGDTTWDPDSVHIPHTTTSHWLTHEASRCCTVARETRERNCRKAISLSSRACPLEGAVGEKEGSSPWLGWVVWPCRHWASTPAFPGRLSPCVVVVVCRCRRVSSCVTWALRSAVPSLPFTAPSAPAPKRSFHFLEVKMTSPLHQE